MAETQSAKPSFNIPKIKRQLSKDNLRTVDLKSRDAQEVCNVVERSFLNSNRTSWEVRAIHMVDNKELESQYRAKRQSMKEEGRHSRELQEHYTFLWVSQPNIQKIAQEGLKTNNLTSFNSLGISNLAVQVCKHADVQLRLAETKTSQTCSLMVFKVTYGKCKPMTVLASSANVEPTPNYDCHTSHERAVPNDIINAQIPKSMVYLYEYNDDCETIDRPRHVLPHAVITYIKSNDSSSSSINKPGYNTSGYIARSHQSAKSQSKEERRANFQQKMAEKIQKRMQMEAELLQRQSPMYLPHPLIPPLPPLYGMHPPVMFTHLAQSTNITRGALDPRVQREQMSARKLEVPVPTSPPLAVQTIEEIANTSDEPYSENEVFEDPYSPSPEDLDENLQSEIDDAIVKMIDLKAKFKQAAKKNDPADDVKKDDDSTEANNEVMSSLTEVRENKEEQAPESKMKETENKEREQKEDVGRNDCEKNQTNENVEYMDDGSHASLDLEKRIEMLSSVISSKVLEYEGSEERKSMKEDITVESPPVTIESPPVTVEMPPVTIESPSKMVPQPPTVPQSTSENVTRKLFSENESVDSAALAVSQIPLPLSPRKSNLMDTSMRRTPPVNSMNYPYVNQQPLHYPRVEPSHTYTHCVEDIDERWHHPSHRDLVVNDMGDVDLRSVPPRDPRTAYGVQYSNHPYANSSILHSRMDFHPSPQNQEQRFPVTMPVTAVHKANFVQQIPKSKENVDSDGSNTDSPSKGKLSLAAYKARKKSGASHLRLKTIRANQCASDSDSVSASDEEGKSFKSPAGHISPRLSPRIPNVNVSPEKLKPPLYNYSYYQMEQAGRAFSTQANLQYGQSEAGGMGISTQANMPNMQGPQLATFQPTVQYENTRNENPGGNTPDSAKSTNFNFIGGSFLDSVNLDISNLKNILQSIAVSPTTSPKKDSKSDTEEFVTSFDDAPWSNVEPVKRQLSEEEAHAAERYDAYNISNTTVDSSVDKSDDCDYDALVAKIKNLRQEIDQMKKNENEGKSPKSTGMDASSIEWPSPLKQIAELQKVDSKPKETVKEDEVGADLLEDLSYFQKSPEAPSIPIPGLGFGESQETSAEDECKDKDSNAVEMIVDITEDSDDGVSNEKSNVTVAKEDISVSSKQVQKEKAEYITIDDEDDMDESMVGLAIVTDDEDEKESDSELVILQPLSPSPAPLPTSVIATDKGTNMLAPSPPDQEVETKTPDVDTEMLQSTTNSTVISISEVDDKKEAKESIAAVPFRGFYKDILTSDFGNIQNKDVLDSTEKSKDEFSHAVRESGTVNPQNVSPLVDAESGASTEHSTPEKNDGTSNDTDKKTEEVMKSLEKLQRTKMRQKMKKSKEMQGYRTRKRTKRGRKRKDVTCENHDLESVGSEISSEFSGVDRSSTVDGSNLSGRGSPSVETVEDKGRVSGPMSLEEFGLGHWREAEKDKKFQPIVRLKLLPDNVAHTIVVKEMREAKSVPFDTEDALPKQERVQAWIEGYASRKKIKLTLKNKGKDTADESVCQIPVIGKNSVTSNQDKPVTDASSSESAMQISSVSLSSSTATKALTTTVQAVSQQISTVSHLPNTNNSTLGTQSISSSYPTTADLYYQAQPGLPLYYQPKTPIPAPRSHIASHPGYLQHHQAVHTLPVRPFVARHQVLPVHHMPRAHVAPSVQVTPAVSSVPVAPTMPVPPPSIPVVPPVQVRPVVPITAPTPPVLSGPLVPVAPPVVVTLPAQATAVSHNHTSVYSQPQSALPYQHVQPSTHSTSTGQGQQQVFPTKEAPIVNQSWTAPPSNVPTSQPHYVPPVQSLYPNTNSLYNSTSQASSSYKETRSQQITKLKDQAKKRSSSDVMDWFADKLAPKKKLHLDISRSDIGDSDSLSRSSGSTGSRTPETPRRTDDLWDIAYGKIQSSAKSSKSESFLESSSSRVSSTKKSGEDQSKIKQTSNSVKYGSLEDHIDSYHNCGEDHRGEDQSKIKQTSNSVKHGSLEDRIDSYRSKIFSDGPEKIKNDPLAENIISIAESELGKSSYSYKVKEAKEKDEETKVKDVKKTDQKESSVTVKKYSEAKQTTDKQKSDVQKIDKEVVDLICTDSDTRVMTEKDSDQVEKTCKPASSKSESGTGVMFKNTLVEVKQAEINKSKSPVCLRLSDTQTEKQETEGVKQNVIIEKTVKKVNQTLEIVSKEGTTSNMKTAEKAFETIESLSREKEMLEKKLAELAKLSPASPNTTGKTETPPDLIVVSDEELEEGEIIDESEEEETVEPERDNVNGRKDKVNSADKRVVISLDSEDENENNRSFSKSKQRLSVTVGGIRKHGDELCMIEVDGKSDQRKVVKETKDLRDELMSGREDERIIYDSRPRREDGKSGHLSRRDEYKRRNRSSSRDRSSSRERLRSRSIDRRRSRSQERHRGSSSHSRDRSHSRYKSKSPDSSHSRERNKSYRESAEKYRAKKSVSDDWSMLLQQEEKRIEKLKYKKKIPSFDDVSNISQNTANNRAATSYEEELKAYSSQSNVDQRKTISYADQDILAPQSQPTKSNTNKLSQTIRAWIREEFGNIETNVLQKNVRCNFDTDIFILSKNQRKTLRNRIRKEVEKLKLVEKMNASLKNVMEKSSVGQSQQNPDQRVVVADPGPPSQPEIASVTVQISVQVIPFQPLEFPKSKIQDELKLIRSHLKVLWVKTQSYSESHEQWNTSSLFSLRQDLQQIETDLVQRHANFDNTYGVPHRRVPDPVLLRSEMSGHMSEEQLVLLLSGAIPSKPYARLTKMREEIHNVTKNMETARSNNQKAEFKALNAQRARLHTDRKAIMLTFTGPLTKKRQNKLKMKLKTYRCCIDYFDNELGLAAVSNLGFVRTTLRDLERHYAIITHLLGEQEENTHRDALKQMSQGIEERKQRAVVEKLKNDLTLVENKLSMMHQEFESNEEICAAINDVLRQIKVALQLIACHHQTERMPPESVTRLRDILQYSLHGYTAVKQQIDIFKASERNEFFVM